MSSLNAPCVNVFPSTRTLPGLLFSHFHGLRWRVVLGAAPFPPNHLDAYEKYALPTHSPLFHLLSTAARSSLSSPTGITNGNPQQQIHTHSHSSGVNTNANPAPAPASASASATTSNASVPPLSSSSSSSGSMLSCVSSSSSSPFSSSVLSASFESMSYWAVVRQICQGHRQKYAQLRQKHIVTEQRLTELSSSPNSFGSLSSRIRYSAADLLSNQFSERVQQQWNSSSALLESIRADLYKTYHQGHDFFTQLVTQKMMERILQIWSLENSSISYQPAMNELLTVLIVALKKDYDLQIPEDAPPELQVIINSQFLEHDAYTLFSQLMTRMTLYFQNQEELNPQAHSQSQAHHSPLSIAMAAPTPSASPPPAITSVQNHTTNAHNPHHGTLHRKSPSMSSLFTSQHARTSSGQVFTAAGTAGSGFSLTSGVPSSSFSSMSSGFASALSISAGGSAVPVSNNPLILLYSPSSSLGSKLDRIHSFLLRETDPNLFAILESLQIAPSLYLNKWIRYLFVKVFPATHQIISVWDYLFTRSPVIHSNSYASFGPSFDTLIDFFCVAMLEAVRFDIFAAVKSAEDDKRKESVMKILSEYPPMEDVHAIFKVADNIRRGLEAIFSARNASGRSSSGGIGSASNAANATPYHFDEREEDQKMEMKQTSGSGAPLPLVASALLALPKSSATKKRTSFFSFDSSASIDFKGIFSSYFSNMPDFQHPLAHPQSATAAAATTAANSGNTAVASNHTNSEHAHHNQHQHQHQHPSPTPTPPPLTPHMAMAMTAPNTSPTNSTASGNSSRTALSTQSKSGFPSVLSSFSDEYGEYKFKTNGFLIKRGGGKRALGRKSYKVRWFVLANGVLTYYESARSTEALKEGIELKHKLIRVQDEERNHFLIVHDPNAPRGSATASASEAAIAMAAAVAAANANADTPTSTAASLAFTFERGNSRERGSHSEGSLLAESRSLKKDSEKERVYELYAEDRACMVQWIGALLNVSNPD